MVGWLGRALKIKVQAPPEKGKANKAVIKLLADRLGMSESDIQIESGHISANKIVSVRGLTQKELEARLNRTE